MFGERGRTASAVTITDSVPHRPPAPRRFGEKSLLLAEAVFSGVGLLRKVVKYKLRPEARRNGRGSRTNMSAQIYTSKYTPAADSVPGLRAHRQKEAASKRGRTRGQPGRAQRGGESEQPQHRSKANEDHHGAQEVRRHHDGKGCPVTTPIRTVAARPTITTVAKKAKRICAIGMGNKNQQCTTD